MLQRWVLMVLGAAWVLSAGGCIANTPLPLVTPPPPATRPAGAVLIHVPGTSGNTVFDDAWTKALKRGGLEVTIEAFEWTRPDKRHLKALRAVEENKHDLQPLVDRITTLFRQDPHRRIILTSQSGGPQIAVWALERLPADVQVDTLVMLNPAMNPHYDLSVALSHVRRHAYVFTSPHDWLYLGIGTRIVGLMDGSKGNGAGQVGFKPPPGARADQYDKLVQMSHRFNWIRFGHFGHHTGALTPFFAKNIIAPILMNEMLPESVR